MSIDTILVTGVPEFLRGYRHLFEALDEHFKAIHFLPEEPPKLLRQVVKARKFLFGRVPTWALHPIDRALITSPWDARLFAQRSQNTEARITASQQQADLVLHVFGMYSPVWNRSDVPYAMVLDYTTHLAWSRYPDWAPFSSRKALEAWLEYERRAYQKAVHLFPFGTQTKQSLVEYYGVDPQRVTVVRSSGQFRSPFQGEKSFGSQTILFNGSDFFRKGGDRVLSAFQLIREAIPTARLVVIGRTLRTVKRGVENPGYVRSPEEMERLFLRVDLVVAPARCDPYPRFLIEAQNYGIPCITSDADGMPDIIEHGRSGLVLGDYSPKRLAEAIVGLLRDKQGLRTMSQWARKRVREHFCWDTIAATIARTLKTPQGLQDDSCWHLPDASGHSIQTPKSRNGLSL